MRLSRNAPLIFTKLLFYDTLPACRAERVKGVQDAHLWSVPHPVKASLHFGLTNHWGHDTPSRAGEPEQRQSVRSLRPAKNTMSQSQMWAVNHRVA